MKAFPKALTFPFLLMMAVVGCDRLGSLSDGAASSGGDASVASSSSRAAASSSSASHEGEAPSEDPSMSVETHSPEDGAQNVALVTAIQVSFSQPVLSQSFGEDLVTVTADGGEIEGNLQQLDDHTFEFAPTKTLAPGTEHQVLVGKAMSASGVESNGYSFSFTTAADIGSTQQSVIDQCMNDRDIVMLAAVNQARQHGRSCGNSIMPAVASLSWNCNLRKAAQTQSDDMATNDFFSHAGSDGSSAGTRVTRSGYQWSSVRENIAAGQRTVAQVMAGWLESEGHCLNIMANNISHFGSAYKESSGSSYQRYWTQVFAAPRR